MPKPRERLRQHWRGYLALTYQCPLWKSKVFAPIWPLPCSKGNKYTSIIITPAYLGRACRGREGMRARWPLTWRRWWSRCRPTWKLSSCAPLTTPPTPTRRCGPLRTIKLAFWLRMLTDECPHTHMEAHHGRSLPEMWCCVASAERHFWPRSILCHCALQQPPPG